MVTGSIGLWQVQENNHGLWRDFPENLRAQAENEFQQWLVDPEQFAGFHYVWPDHKKGTNTPYVVMFPESPMNNATAVCSMRQINQHTLGERRVRRIPLPRAA